MLKVVSSPSLRFFSLIKISCISFQLTKSTSRFNSLNGKFICCLEVQASINLHIVLRSTGLIDFRSEAIFNTSKKLPCDTQLKISKKFQSARIFRSSFAHSCH